MAEEFTVTPCPVPEWEGADNNSSAMLVRSQFQTATEYVNNWSVTVSDLMNQIKELLVSEMPSAPSIDYDFVEAPVTDFGDIGMPTRPDITMPDVIDAPVMRGELEEITVREISPPIDDTPTEEPPDFTFEEDEYVSSLLSSIQSTLDSIVSDNGYGLSDTILQESIDIAVDKNLLTHENERLKIVDFYSSRNYRNPPGAVNAGLDTYERDRIRTEANLIAEITNEHNKLKLQDRQAILQLSKDLEGLTMEQKNRINERAYQYAKDVVTFFHQIFKMKLDRFLGKMEGYKAEWSAEEIRVRAIDSRNKSITSTFVAELDGWKTRILSELGIIEQIVKVYIAEQTGYESAVRSEAEKAKVLIEKYRAQIQESGQRAEIAVSEADLIFKSMVNRLELNKSSMENIAKIATQIVASALSAFNASATLSSSFASSEQYGYNRSVSCSNATQESVSSSKNYHYSVTE